MLQKLKQLLRLEKKHKAQRSTATVDSGDLLHLSFNIVLPFALLALIRLDLTMLAILLALLSKWRTFAVRMNHLPANLRANMTDIIFKLSILSFMIGTNDLRIQLIFAAIYATWLLAIKPLSNKRAVAMQALIAQFTGLTALFWFSDGFNVVVLLVGVWIVVYTTTQHYLNLYEDAMSRVMSKLWALFAVQLAWLFYHWNLRYFSVIPQYVLIQSAFSYLMADIYKNRSITSLAPDKVRNYVLTAVFIVVVILVSGDWSGQII